MFRTVPLMSASTFDRSCFESSSVAFLSVLLIFGDIWSIASFFLDCMFVLLLSRDRIHSNLSCSHNNFYARRILLALPLYLFPPLNPFSEQKQIKAWQVREQLQIAQKAHLNSISGFTPLRLYVVRWKISFKNAQETLVMISQCYRLLSACKKDGHPTVIL